MRRSMIFLLLFATSLASALDLNFVVPGKALIKTKRALSAGELAQLKESFQQIDELTDVVDVAPAFEADFGDGIDFPAARYATVTLSEGTRLEKALKALAGSGNVEIAEPIHRLSDPDLLTTSDPKLSAQWYLDRLKVREAWELTKGKDILVADVESGFDTEHPDLVNQFDRERSYDYDPESTDTSKVNDNKMSHGTPVCGIIAAEGNNSLFGVGIAFEATLIGSQMADSWGTHSNESLWTVNTAKAILGSVLRGAHVVLIEKQLPSTSSSVEQSRVIYDAIKAAVEKGVPVIVPAGNFSNELTVEAAQPDSGSIFVGATATNDTPAYFSDYGSRVDVAAPGESVYSVQEGNSETGSFGGTSSASAITAGVTALVRAANPRLSPREIRAILKETGTPIENSASTPIGVLLNARDAVKRALDS